MQSRRKFMAQLAAAGAGISLFSPSFAFKRSSRSNKALPLVLATWNNKNATAAAMDQLVKNGTTLDAVEAGARIPEADPNDTSVGFGGFPDRDGNVTLDACIMDYKGNAGSVTYLQHIKHPVSVARKVMEKTPHVMLSGDGALDFAISEGFKKEILLTESSKNTWEEWKKKANYSPQINAERHDTIGILAVDKDKNISGACTTSGLAFKMKGRVGDSPIIGAGLFVDNEIGGACATGLGEMVMKTLGSFLIVELMRQGHTPQEACEEAVKRIANKYESRGNDFQVGYIAVNKQGDHGAYSYVPGFNYTLNTTENKVIEARSFRS